MAATIGCQYRITAHGKLNNEANYDLKREQNLRNPWQ